jgi:hypothetical protein
LKIKFLEQQLKEKEDYIAELESVMPKKRRKISSSRSIDLD